MNWIKVNCAVLYALVYVNHRPAFGLSPDKLLWAFDTLGTPGSVGHKIERGELLELLQNKGEQREAIRLIH